MDRATIRHKANEIRSRVIPPKTNNIAAPIDNFINWKKVGKRCPQGMNGWWRFLAKTMRKPQIMKRILDSPFVPDEVYDKRMEICRKCIHVAIKTNGEHYCVCCGCPAFSYASLENKNKHSLHMCTASSPKFREFKDSSNTGV